VDNNTYTRYYYDGLTVIAEKKKGGEEGAGVWDRIFTVVPGVIGNILCISTKSGESWVDAWYHYDAIGNVIMTSNSSSSIISSIDQEAYGNVKVGSQSSYHLTTKEYDSISELYYFWQRWYDPMLGKFISTALYPSHIEYPYGYTNNNPINYIDPRGLLPEKKLEELKRVTDHMLESCGFTRNSEGKIVGGNKPFIDQEGIALCCEALRKMGVAIWGDPSWWQRLLIGGAAVVNNICANDCACINKPGATGFDVIKHYAKCMGKHADDLFGGGKFGIPGITP
jgi:RHS repeat-associated protein